MGIKKLWLSMHPRNLGSEKDRGVSGINRIAARTFRDKQQQQQQQKRLLIFMSILA